MTRETWWIIVTTPWGVLVIPGAGSTGSAVVTGGAVVTGTAVVTVPVPDDWVQPAMKIHAITARRRKIPGYLIFIFLFQRSIRLLYEA